MSAVPAAIPLAIDALRRARGAARFGASIHYFESIDSTNTCAQQLARDGAAEGTAVIAETQTKGRGRLGRSWVSPPFRNLYMSLILRPPFSPEEAPQLTLVVGLATAEAVAEWAPRALIKWPNDVLLEGRKVAGILTELGSGSGLQGPGGRTSHPEARTLIVVTGIGVNLNISRAEFPAELQDKAVGLGEVTGKPIDRAEFANRLLSHLEDRYALFLRAGFKAIQPLWEKYSCLQGRSVEVDDSGRRCAGRVIGLAEDGTLRLQTSAGTEVRIVAGDVSVVDGYASEADR